MARHSSRSACVLVAVKFPSEETPVPFSREPLIYPSRGVAAYPKFLQDRGSWGGAIGAWPTGWDPQGGASGTRRLPRVLKDPLIVSCRVLPHTPHGIPDPDTKKTARKPLSQAFYSCDKTQGPKATWGWEGIILVYIPRRKAGRSWKSAACSLFSWFSRPAFLHHPGPLT